MDLQIGYSGEDQRNVPETSSKDLDSGNRSDIFLAANKVGKGRKAIGVDMTKEMICRARATASRYEYENVEFRLS